MVRKALIPAAGLGTRFLPVTKAVPKELLPIVNRPALQYIVEELAQSGIEEIVLVISPDKKEVADYFARGGDVEKMLAARGKLDHLSTLHTLLDRVRFSTAYQEEALGLGHAVLCGQAAIGSEPFAVVLPDDLVRSKVPCLQQLVNCYEKDGCSVLAVEKVAAEQVSHYGIVSGAGAETGQAFRVQGIVEKPAPQEAPSRWAIIGRYVLDSEIFEYLKKTKPAAGGEIQLTDALEVLARDRGLTAYPFEGRRLDAGQPPGYLQANLTYAWDDPDLRKFLQPILKELLKQT